MELFNRTFVVCKNTVRHLYGMSVFLPTVLPNVTCTIPLNTPSLPGFCYLLQPQISKQESACSSLWDTTIWIIGDKQRKLAKGRQFCVLFKLCNRRLNDYEKPCIGLFILLRNHLSNMIKHRQSVRNTSKIIRALEQVQTCTIHVLKITTRPLC